MLSIVILAAGLGTRLGRPHPKPLTPLADGRTILRQQLEHIDDAFGADARVSIVVGFGEEQVRAAAGHRASFVRNDRFATTGTAESLRLALREVGPGGVLWMNGDVVFAPGLLAHVRGRLADGDLVAVDTARVGDEEVKYTLDGDGCVGELSKRVVGGLGEAVGVNHVSARGRPALLRQLGLVDERDYFEAGIERSIAEGARWRPVDVSRFGAVEVDFPEDLVRANELSVLLPPRVPAAGLVAPVAAPPAASTVG